MFSSDVQVKLIHAISNEIEQLDNFRRLQAAELWDLHARAGPGPAVHTHRARMFMLRLRCARVTCSGASKEPSGAKCNAGAEHCAAHTARTWT